MSTINSQLNQLEQQVNQILSQVNSPQANQVATFIGNNIKTDELILDSLANELQSTGGSEFANLDALLANDVLSLTELQTLYEVQSLANGTGA